MFSGELIWLISGCYVFELFACEKNLEQKQAKQNCLNHSRLLDLTHICLFLCTAETDFFIHISSTFKVILMDRLCADSCIVMVSRLMLAVIFPAIRNKSFNFR